MAFRPEKTVASFFVNSINAPLLPEYAFNSAQQSHRFVLEVSGLDIAFIQDVKRPSVSVEYQTYDYLGYELKFPKKIRWEAISFNVIESYDPRILGTVLGNMMQKFTSNSYRYPNLVFEEKFSNLSKRNIMSDFGNIVIKTLDPDGKIVDTWRIYNPMISKITPSQLTYATDNLTNIGIELQYDWAEYGIGGDIRPGLISAGVANYILP